MDLEGRKKEIIEIISKIENEALIARLEKALRNLEEDKKSLNGLLRPTKDVLDIEQMRKEQGFRGIDRNKFEQLTQDINLQGDVETLLSEI